jgi:hypothetical protein
MLLLTGSSAAHKPDPSTSSNIILFPLRGPFTVRVGASKAAKLGL